MKVTKKIEFFKVQETDYPNEKKLFNCPVCGMMNAINTNMEVENALCDCIRVCNVGSHFVTVRIL